MNTDELFKLKINKPDSSVYLRAKGNWDHISKPIDGLGDFETLICRLAAITGDETPDISRRAAVIMCADNGVVKEGISQSDKSITKAVAVAIARNISSSCTLGKSVSCDVFPVDIGIDDEESCEGVLDRKIAMGTKDFLTEPAMTREQTLSAIETGIDLVKKLKDEGYKLLVTGEMGIGNTTTSAAVLCALLSEDPDVIAGRGAGLDDAGLARKKEVIKEALLKYKKVFDEITDQREMALEILTTLGGLDIAGMTGLFIGAAAYEVPILIDGVISAVSAFIAETICPGAREYMIPTHKGREAGLSLILKRLDLEPYINGSMALGEGTGALMFLPLIDTALSFYKNAASFKEYEIEEYKRLS
jgi:nicotinate-nucleotide--dimethylbenzimidazole phosphoribosyltransferase